MLSLCLLFLLVGKLQFFLQVFAALNQNYYILLLILFSLVASLLFFVVFLLGGEVGQREFLRDPCEPEMLNEYVKIKYDKRNIWCSFVRIELRDREEKRSFPHLLWNILNSMDLFSA